MMKKYSKQNGTVLLLSLMIMAAIITISLATGTLISSEIQQSSQLDRATISYFAAESAVERAMYQLRQLSADPEVINGLTALLPNNAQYEIIAQEAEPAVYANLQQDETLELDLYQPGTLTALDPPIKSLRFNWTSEANSWLEVRWLPWTTGGLIDLSSEQGIKISMPDAPYPLNLFDANDYLYKVRITARFAAVNNLQVMAYNIINPDAQNCTGFPGPNSDCSVDIPQRIKIKGIGEYPYNSDKSSKQAILVTLSSIDQLSGLYDYVIFSEEAVTK